MERWWTRKVSIVPPIPPVIDWCTCPPAPLAWIPLRELLLGLVHTPALLLPLTAALGLALSAVYSDLATALLSGWLQSQLPAAPSFAPAAVVVLLGRGDAIAAAGTETAAQRLRQGQAVAAYVSGDARPTTERLVQLGIAPSRIAGDSCARTTWENATLTAAWLGQQHPGAPVLLITDPWQLPLAAAALIPRGVPLFSGDSHTTAGMSTGEQMYYACSPVAPGRGAGRPRL